VLPSALTFLATFALGTPNLAPLARLSLGAYPPARPPDLAVHAADAGTFDAPPPAVRGGSLRVAAVGGIPVCLVDVCQPVVQLPGYAPAYSSRSAREEAFVALLTRSRVAPLETVGWALAASGLRFEYAPAAFDAASAGAHGWGKVGVRVRLRLDAHNGVVVPSRP
jgi:hypothetical protein